MGFLAKADALFVGLRVSNSFHQSLLVAPETTAQLKAARKEARGAIRAASTAIQLNDAYWEPSFAAKSARNRLAVEPRFLTQGSVAYDLLINRCQNPPQQLDLDDGMYVRVEFLNGRPALVAKALFEMVEKALEPLCKRKGWVLNKSKQTCVRVEINSESHIDIPIYSAPRHVESALMFASDSLQKSMVVDRAGKEIERLPSDEIMLAHRDGTWQQSDPLRLHEWVDNCVVRYGPEFRRACRYFKGWRDHTWKGCCLSSITIMAAVADAFEQMAGGHRSMADDRLVFEIAQRLPSILNSPISNPAFPGEDILLNDWSDEEAELVVGAADQLATEMRDALQGTGVADLVVKALRKAFGARIPNRPDMIVIAQTVAASVASEVAAKVPAPRVTNSTSG